MAKQLGLLPDMKSSLQEAKYARLVDGKIIYITEAEVAEEEVLATTDDELGKWDSFIQQAEQMKQRISIVHQMMRDDVRRPSQYLIDYDELWYRYREVIGHLRMINPEFVEQFGDKVVAKVKELEVRLGAMYGAWNPDDFEDFEELLALYEKLHDQAVALGWEEDRALTRGAGV